MRGTCARGLRAAFQVGVLGKCRRRVFGKCAGNVWRCARELSRYFPKRVCGRRVCGKCLREACSESPGEMSGGNVRKCAGYAREVSGKCTGSVWGVRGNTRERVCGKWARTCTGSARKVGWKSERSALEVCGKCAQSARKVRAKCAPDLSRSLKGFPGLQIGILERALVTLG